MLARLKLSRNNSKPYLKSSPRFLNPQKPVNLPKPVNVEKLIAPPPPDETQHGQTILQNLLPSLHRSWIRRPLPSRDTIIHMAIDARVKKGKEPATAFFFEQIISSLLYIQQYELAESVYKRMVKKGFTPSTRIILQLLTPGLKDADEATIRHLIHLVQDPTYREKDMVAYLKYTHKLKIPDEVIAPIVEGFRLSRGPEFRPPVIFLKVFVTSAARLGNIEDAFQILENYPQPTNLKAAPQRGIFSAYMGLLATLRETRKWNDQLCNRVLQLMSKRGRWAKVQLFDELIAGEMSIGNGEVALFIFSMLKEMIENAEAKIAPTIHTFDYIMDLYRAMDPNTLKAFQQAESGAHTPLRPLLRFFLRAFSNTRERIYLSSHMNLAIRAFMAHRDYAGALMVLDTFVSHGAKVDNKTYNAIVKLLMLRTSQDMHTRRIVSVPRWGDRFLGIVFKDTRVEFSVKLVNHILYLVTRKRFDVEKPLYAQWGVSFREINVHYQSQYYVPTFEQMKEPLLPPKEREYYDPVPLRRLLCRAILAEDPEGGIERVYEAIQKAYDEMLSWQDTTAEITQPPPTTIRRRSREEREREKEQENAVEQPPVERIAPSSGDDAEEFFKLYIGTPPATVEIPAASSTTEKTKSTDSGSERS
ncbi:hypothetical protein CPC08DRAFT_764114 [Agrocybe pediades]|nr:hypothetical protein CPC08DRAFT_764114 [Agrocybe pediades]